MDIVVVVMQTCDSIKFMDYNIGLSSHKPRRRVLRENVNSI